MDTVKKDSCTCVEHLSDEDLLKAGLTPESIDELSNNKGEDE